MTSGVGREAAPLQRRVTVAVADLPPAQRRPLVSVLVTCYNYAHFVEACLDSALTQEGVELEVVAVDDCSKDDSVAVMRSVAERDPRVRVVVNEHNLGQVGSINAALAHARGDYLVKLDADDLLAPGALRRSVDLLENHPGVGFAYGPVVHFRDQPPPAPAPDGPRWTLWPGRQWLARRCREATNAVSSPEVMMRATAVAGVGPFRTDMPHTHDMFMWFRLAAGWDVARLHGAVQAFYRVHSGSLQRTVNSSRLLDLSSRRDAFDALYAAGLRGVADTTGWQLATRRELARQALDRACRAYDRGRTATEPVEGYLAFAQEMRPDALRTPAGQGLRLRRALGPRWSRVMPYFVLRSVVRRGQDELAAWRWRRTGV